MNNYKNLISKPYPGYLYAYPHKSAYRDFRSKRLLRNIWAKEHSTSHFLYVHIPFCETKCHFCNLFSSSTAYNDGFADRYIEQIRLEAEVFSNEVGYLPVDVAAVGGGTPSILSVKQIEKLLDILSFSCQKQISEIDSSFELSPLTLTDEKLSLLIEKNVNRLSIGVQSFIESERQSAGRYCTDKQLRNALKSLFSYDFPIKNIDLIYGLPLQTFDSWVQTLEECISYEPDEIYLYPLYARALTGFDRQGRDQQLMLRLYRYGRDFLRKRGYEQDSMRLFKKHTQSKEHIYKCQEDGMIGLGVGSRSYTSSLHYSNDYGIKEGKVRQIIDSYMSMTADDFRYVMHGIELSLDEQKRRYIIKSLLKKEGLRLLDYQKMFGRNPDDDFRFIEIFVQEGLVKCSENTLLLTDEGMMLSDAIGNVFISEQVRELMGGFVLA